MQALLDPFLSNVSDTVVMADPRQLASDSKTSLTMIPVDFVTQWKQWIRYPNSRERPTQLDNRSFLCRHEQLLIDPANPGVMDAPFSLVSMEAWKALSSLLVLHRHLTFQTRRSESHI